jgi:uncharacterized protein
VKSTAAAARRSNLYNKIWIIGEKMEIKMKKILCVAVVLIVLVEFSMAQKISKSHARNLPSPANVMIDPAGRFHERYHGNVEYLKYQYEVYGEFMLQAFASRQYSPGKLLERMWDGEYAGKWLDATTRSAVNTGDEDLLNLVDEFAASLRKYQKSDGYMGIHLPVDRELNAWEKEWDNWNQWNCMIGFLTHYELRGDLKSLQAASRIADWIVNTFGSDDKMKNDFARGEIINGMTNVVIIGQIMRLYRHTGDKSHLNFVDKVIRNFPPARDMVTTGKPYLVHPYMLSALLTGILEYAIATDNTEMSIRVEQIWDELNSTYMFPTGSLGEREDLQDDPIKDIPDGQLQETCATTEWIFLTMALYEKTGNVKYIDALEKTSYNALIGAQSDDGMKWCYWTPLRYSKHFLHGPTRCCFWSGPRGIARLPQLIYATKGNEVYVNLFESSQAELTTKDGSVTVSQKSGFPAEGKSNIRIKAPMEWEGTVNIRVPAWAKQLSVIYNGTKFPYEKSDSGYLVIKLTGKKEYQINVQFDLALRVEKLADNYVICRGPEVLALDTRDNIDTWLGAHDDLISLPESIEFLPLEPGKRYQWPGPISAKRRRYLVKVNDARTDELRAVVLTPYADAGNEGAAFRTAFPRDAESNYPSSWKE